MEQGCGVLESRWSTVQNLPLHYMMSVRPEPVFDIPIVMVHGLAVSCRYMLPTAERLALHHRVYAPDLLGFGRSHHPATILNITELADVLAEWMQTIHLEKAVLLGNSLGCQIIAQFALRHPERLALAIMAGPTMDPQARSASKEIIRWLRNIPGEPFSLFPIVIRDFLSIGIRRFIGTFRYGLQDRIEEHLPHIQAPTLIVRGARDTVVPQSWVEEATQLLPNGRLIVIPGSAHDVNYNAPIELTNVTRAFITEQLQPVKKTELAH